MLLLLGIHSFSHDFLTNACSEKHKHLLKFDFEEICEFISKAKNCLTRACPEGVFFARHKQIDKLSNFNGGSFFNSFLGEARKEQVIIIVQTDSG